MPQHLQFEIPAELVTPDLGDGESVPFILLLMPNSSVAFHPQSGKSQNKPTFLISKPLCPCCLLVGLWAPGAEQHPVVFLRHERESQLLQHHTDCMLASEGHWSDDHLCLSLSQQHLDVGPLLTPHSLTASLPSSSFIWGCC